MRFHQEALRLYLEFQQMDLLSKRMRLFNQTWIIVQTKIAISQEVVLQSTTRSIIVFYVADFKEQTFDDSIDFTKLIGFRIPIWIAQLQKLVHNMWCRLE